MSPFQASDMVSDFLTFLGGKEMNIDLEWVNLFTPNARFLYPLKTLEKLNVFWCFQREERVRLEQMS